MGPSNIGGRVVDLAIDPELEDTIYIASATGGVWKSIDAGLNFSSIWKDTNSQAIGAIAIDKNGVLYVGTGESNPGGGSVVFGGTGIFKSVDRGESWQKIGLEDSHAIGKIIIDPNNPSSVFVAALGPLFVEGGQRGLFHSTDGGKTWKNVTPKKLPKGGRVESVEPSHFKEGKVFVQSVFNTYDSWVLPEGRNDYVLRHEQIHFDITEIYSRKLRKELADAKVTSANLIKAKAIFDKVFNELQKRQNKYDRETKHGDKKETQENWEAIVEIELAKYEFYKEN